MTDEPWTREQFEAYYNKGGILPGIREGRLSIECHREKEPGCHGWKMTHLEWLDDDMRLYGNTQTEVDAAIAHRNELLRLESM